MPVSDFEAEQLTEEDRGYKGSRFREVVDAIFANPYQRVWGGQGEPPLPLYKVSFGSLLGGRLLNASARALDSGADLRWGADRKGFRRLLHPNGARSGRSRSRTLLYLTTAIR